jgi:hypothetical protein
VKVDVGWRYAVNLALGFGDAMKDSERVPLHECGEFAPSSMPRISEWVRLWLWS